jgi:hypothetical protein
MEYKFFRSAITGRNEWPGGIRRAMYQHEHEKWNETHYPGTLQLCQSCEAPTERCEEDSIFTESGEGPLCVNCWKLTLEYNRENES